MGSGPHHRTSIKPLSPSKAAAHQILRSPPSILRSPDRQGASPKKVSIPATPHVLVLETSSSPPSQADRVAWPGWLTGGQVTSAVFDGSEYYLFTQFPGDASCGQIFNIAKLTEEFPSSEFLLGCPPGLIKHIIHKGGGEVTNEALLDLMKAFLENPIYKCEYYVQNSTGSYITRSIYDPFTELDPVRPSYFEFCYHDDEADIDILERLDVAPCTEHTFERNSDGRFSLSMGINLFKKDASGHYLDAKTHPPFDGGLIRCWQVPHSAKSQKEIVKLVQARIFAPDGTDRVLPLFLTVSSTQCKEDPRLLPDKVTLIPKIFRNVIFSSPRATPASITISPIIASVLSELRANIVLSDTFLDRLSPRSHSHLPTNTSATTARLSTCFSPLASPLASSPPAASPSIPRQKRILLSSLSPRRRQPAATPTTSESQAAGAADDSATTPMARLHLHRTPAGRICFSPS